MGGGRGVRFIHYTPGIGQKQVLSVTFLHPITMYVTQNAPSQTEFIGSMLCPPISVMATLPLWREFRQSKYSSNT